MFSKIAMMLLSRAPDKDKRYLYYLVISQLQYDGFKEQADVLQQMILQTENLVTPSCVLYDMVKSSISGANLITDFFNNEAVNPRTSERPMLEVVQEPQSVSLQDSLPQSLSLEESLKSCVELFNTEIGQSGESGLSEVFQIIDNLTKISGSTSAADAVAGPASTTSSTNDSDGIAVKEEPCEREENVNLDQAIETLHQSLITLQGQPKCTTSDVVGGSSGGGTKLTNSLTGTPNMLVVSVDDDVALSPGGQNEESPQSSGDDVKPFSLADKQLRCPTCEYLTFSKRAYTLHLRSHDADNARRNVRMPLAKHNYSGNKLVLRPYACKLCKYRAPSRIQLTLHIRTHTGEKPHPCPYCDYRTAQKGNLKKHIEFRHAKMENNVHCCNLCTFKTPSKVQLSLHINQNHRERGKERDSALEKRYRCKLCDFRCVWVGSLRSHMFDKHPETINRNRADPPEHKCPECDYTSQWRGNLNTHILRKHTKPESVNGVFTCKRCNFQTSTKEELDRHVESHLHDDRPYQCHLCDYRAGLKNTLETHMKYKHSDEKPFSCEVCSYRCVTKGQLTIHLRKHTGERPYKCPYCPYDTAQQSNLKSHVKHRHPNLNQHIFNSKRGRKRKYPSAYDDNEYGMYSPISMAYGLNKRPGTSYASAAGSSEQN